MWFQSKIKTAIASKIANFPHAMYLTPHCKEFHTSLQVVNINETILWLFVNVLMMGKLSNEDKMRIQTLREQGLGLKR